MRKQFVPFVMFAILAAWAAPAARAQDAKGVLSNASKAMGADGVKSVQYSGTATEFAFGQAVNVSSPWPGFAEKSYTRTINYETPAWHVDRVLADAGLADAAPYRHARGIAARAIENLRRDQFIVEDNVGILQGAQRLDGEQIRIARTRADQRYPAFRLTRPLRAGESGWISNILQRSFSFITAAGENQRANGAIDDALPEAAAQRKLRNAAVDGFAPAADERGEIADPRRQHSFDALADAARHHWRGSAGADGNYDIAAIDNGRKNESRMREIIHHIDGQPDRLRPRRDRNPDVGGARAQDRNHATQIGRQRIAFAKLNPRRIGSLQPAHIVIAVDGVPADARTRRQQQAQLRPRQLATSYEQDGAGLKIEEYRQESHSTLAAPTSGVD